MALHEADEDVAHQRIMPDVGTMVVAGNDELLATRQTIDDELGVGREDEVIFAGADEGGNLDALQISMRHLGFKAHHAHQGWKAVNHGVGTENVGKGLGIDGILSRDVGTARDDKRTGAGIGTLEQEGDDAAVAPPEHGWALHALSGNEGMDIIGHVGIVIFGHRAV